jgi:hypothetical protein
MPERIECPANCPVVRHHINRTEAAADVASNIYEEAIDRMMEAEVAAEILKDPDREYEATSLTRIGEAALRSVAEISDKDSEYARMLFSVCSGAVRMIHDDEQGFIRVDVCGSRGMAPGKRLELVWTERVRDYRGVEDGGNDTQ